MAKKKSAMESYWEDITTLAKLKKEMSPDREITIPVSLAQDICNYCENMAIYDKLANYGDFYYKLKKLIED
jgi:hypothetical protein